MGSEPKLLTPDQLALGLLGALDALDQESAPLGLYSVDELGAGEPASWRWQQEWRRALGPALQEHGAARLPREASERGAVGFEHPELGSCSLLLRRVASIKVRRFGSKYRVDPEVDHPERWKSANLAKLLNEMQYSRARALGDQAQTFLLLLAFSRDMRPFEVELNEKDVLKPRAALGSVDRIWPDRHDRGFYVRATAWFTHAAGSRPLNT